MKKTKIDYKEINALICEHIYGQQVKRNKDGEFSIGSPEYKFDEDDFKLKNSVPDYSHNLNLAFDVIRTFEGKAKFDLQLLDNPTRYNSTLSFHLGLGEYIKYESEALAPARSICGCVYLYITDILEKTKKVS